MSIFPIKSLSLYVDKDCAQHKGIQYLVCHFFRTFLTDVEIIVICVATVLIFIFLVLLIIYLCVYGCVLPDCCRSQ